MTTKIDKRNVEQIEKLAKESISQSWCSILSFKDWSLKFISSVENIVFKLEAKNNYILRVTEKTHRNQEQLKSELNYISYLRDNE